MRYFCSCDREISVGNTLQIMVYRQKDGLRFPGLKLCFGVHKSVIFPIQRICRLLSQAVWGVPATPVFRPPPRMRYSLMLPSTGPPSSLSIYYKTTESVKCQVILVLLIGDIWRETQIKHMQRASKNLTPATRGKVSEISHPPVKSFTPLSLNSGRRKSISFLLLNSGPLKHLPLKTALFLPEHLNCVHTRTHTAPLLRVINIA